MVLSPAMNEPQSPRDTPSPAKERAAGILGVNEQKPSPSEASTPQKQDRTTTDHHSDEDHVAVDASPSKKRRRTMSGEIHVNGAATDAERHMQPSEEKEEECVEVRKGNGHVGDEKEIEKETEEASEAVGNGTVNKGPEEKTQDQQEQKKQSVDEEVQVNGGQEEEKTTEEASKSEEAASVSARVPSPAVHVSSGDMVFPDDEVPIELCPFSSDGSVETESPPRRTAKTVEIASETATATPTAPAAAAMVTPATPAEVAPVTPASVTAEDSVTPNLVNRNNGRRKRRKKLSYSASRNKAAAKVKQDMENGFASPALEDKISIPVNGFAADNGVDVNSNGGAPLSPVYPDADASHLYPSTPEGAAWRWGDVDPYFDPLAQSDMDNLVRWRKENADFVAANSSVWRGETAMEKKRAELQAVLADASDASTAHVEFPVRRGRNYRDVWEERDFLEQQKRDNSVGETVVKSQVVKTAKKRKGAVDAEHSLLASHRDLVYGYDDDLFQEFRGHLEERVKACQSDSPPATPPTPLVRRQQGANVKVDEGALETAVQEVIFDEEIMPSFPVRHVHPASLGLWKLRKNQEPDFSVVHPASVNRSRVPARWKEEKNRHNQQQYELQLQQTDELGDPSDGDDEATEDNPHDRRVTISNSEVTGGLPSFGNSVEEDEISQTLAASMRKLISLSMYNWRTAQLVYERAACSIQCAPILEGEAAAARELEDVFLQVYPPDDNNTDAAVPPGTVQNGPTRQPRTPQINNVPYDMIAYSVRHDIADNCAPAVAASVEFALGLSVGDVVDVLDRNGCWNYGEVVEIYSEGTQGLAKFLLMRFSLWSEDAVEWIAASEGRIVPQGVADGSRPCSVGPTRSHRTRVRYDQILARALERSFPQRQAKQATAASQMLAQRHHSVVIRSSSDQQKTPQKRKRKRPAKSALVSTTTT